MRGVQIEKPRIFQSSRDFLLSIGVLLFAMFLTVGFTGLCSFNPGPAERSGEVQKVDAATFLGLEARSVDYPIVLPEMPEGWVANSARRTQVGDQPGSLVGWVIDGKDYISLTQTAADMKAAAFPDDSARSESSVEKIDAGAEGALEWHVYTGDDVRPRWVADRGDHRLILEGMAGFESMKTAAERVSTAKPIDTDKSMTAPQTSEAASS
ncbi:DUF4245 domain-containing protein [Corynebacterium sp. 320]|uniref:DUF4245 domain-containing protein n=1 Tax=Corynebacterium TaxID=1716 RepID=UPI00125CAA8B|nr:MULTISPECIES: DUF4245 domain-containing protein [Corynebacterium]KAB1504017.1 DUF4245 domain-containing protein [Corynebacterium sp. 320]KAB1552884.1 DUF4245 domain-containing protein [Corynebacterium sp. 321]KAB1553898.1 DUF4245 domain-containing protein [Corynebacterium sp. 319]KAB3528153.1 DUF4245 domain-containing protein [Corynebacterium sp. 250]KAB3540359.1 DUF4245 domain-containing protein [Corynebacterium sp. 366]